MTTSYTNGGGQGGFGAADVATPSTDVGDLQAQLAQARDRLAFYEGFDRVIADNVRRSGELMLEVLAIRESMAASAEHGDRQEREHLAAGLSDLERRLDAIRSDIVAVGGQVAELRRSLGIELVPAPVGAAMPSPPPPAPETAATVTGPAPAWIAPQVIDVIAHQIAKATVALSLQRHLGNLDAVSGVEAREFAEGILRMQVTAHRPLTAGDLTGWDEGGQVSVLQLQPTLVELAVETAS